MPALSGTRRLPPGEGMQYCSSKQILRFGLPAATVIDLLSLYISELAARGRHALFFSEGREAM